MYSSIVLFFNFSSPESEPKIYIYNVKSICPHCYNYYGIDDSAENVDDSATDEQQDVKPDTPDTDDSDENAND